MRGLSRWRTCRRDRFCGMCVRAYCSYAAAATTTTRSGGVLIRRHPHPLDAAGRPAFVEEHGGRMHVRCRGDEWWFASGAEGRLLRAARQLYYCSKGPIRCGVISTPKKMCKGNPSPVVLPPGVMPGRATDAHPTRRQVGPALPHSR
jgi:hypothetical protein